MSTMSRVSAASSLPQTATAIDGGSQGNAGSLIYEIDVSNYFISGARVIYEYLGYSE